MTPVGRRPPPDGEPVIAAEGLRKRYGRRLAVSDLSVELHSGEVLGLLGPNGAGTSTTVKMLTGLVRPTSGRVHIDGLDVADPGSRRRLGYLPEQFRFPDWMTGRELLRLHRRLSGAPPDEDLVARLLDRVGLAGRGDDRIADYSKGMQQRVGIAQALVGEPRAVLLDEPTSALDPLGRRHVRDLVRELARSGVAVMINSHLLSEVEVTCDRVVIVDRGRVVRSGRVDDLALAAAEIRVELDLVDDEVRALLGRYGAVVASDATSAVLAADSPDVAPLVADALVSAGYRLRALVPLRRSLEDVFVGLVRETGDGDLGIAGDDSPPAGSTGAAR